jgi:hypothetical protein
VREGVERLSNPKQYLVAGILVEAVLSEGGGFYEVTVVETGFKCRYLAPVFEIVATPYVNLSSKEIK